MGIARMGVEYKIRFSAPSFEQLDRELRWLSQFAQFDPTWQSYSYREIDCTGAMPNAEVKLEPDGLYFCDHGGGTSVLGALVAKLASQYGRVEIDEYAT